MVTVRQQLRSSGQGVVGGVEGLLDTLSHGAEGAELPRLLLPFQLAKCLEQIKVEDSKFSRESESDGAAHSPMWSIKTSGMSKLLPEMRAGFDKRLGEM